eukprot:4260444-Amphidinium_carterae.1
MIIMYVCDSNNIKRWHCSHKTQLLSIDTLPELREDQSNRMASNSNTNTNNNPITNGWMLAFGMAIHTRTYNKEDAICRSDMATDSHANQ